ncbi:hypothetical protein ACWEQ7_04170 [Streptomyces sp. NPDC004069]
MNHPLAVAILAWPLDCALLYGIRAAWRALLRTIRNHRKDH